MPRNSRSRRASTSRSGTGNFDVAISDQYEQDDISRPSIEDIDDRPFDDEVHNFAFDARELIDLPMDNEITGEFADPTLFQCLTRRVRSAGYDRGTAIQLYRWVEAGIAAMQAGLALPGTTASTASGAEKIKAEHNIDFDKTFPLIGRPKSSKHDVDLQLSDESNVKAARRILRRYERLIKSGQNLSTDEQDTLRAARRLVRARERRSSQHPR